MEFTDFYDVYTIVFMTVLLMVLSIVPSNLGLGLIGLLMSGNFMIKVNHKFKGY